MPLSSRKVDYTPVHPAPGHGKSLDWTPNSDDEIYVGSPLPTALLQDSVMSAELATDENIKKAFLPVLTVREFLMLCFMNVVFDEAIIAKWRAEAVLANGVNETTMTEIMFDFCIAELRHKAQHVYSDARTPIVVYNGDVVKSDTAVPQSVKYTLQEAVKVLENVPASQKDWHPGSNEMVLDLVHPSLFPLVYGKSRVLKVGEKVVGLDDCVLRCGEGDVLELDNKAVKELKKRLSDNNRVLVNPYSSKFQWLPCEVDISGASAKIISYINNFHPKHGDIYGLVEKLVDASIPLWERTLAPLHADKSKFFERIACKQVRYEGEDEEDKDGEEGGNDEGYWTDVTTSEDTDNEEEMEGSEDGDEQEGDDEEDSDSVEGSEGDSEVNKDEGEDDETEEDNDGEESTDDNSDGGGFDLKHDNETDEEKPVIQPEPKAFDAKKFKAHKPLSFKELYGQQGRPLQIIVKLANIKLTPEKPKYNGGTWHVEGKQNEHICATAIYYYSLSNIRPSHLAFKQFVETEFVHEFGYNQGDHGFLREYFGCKNEEPGVQYVGEVETEGRLLTFPNILQHQVQPFELDDPTKPGHRKIVAFSSSTWQGLFACDSESKWPG